MQKNIIEALKNAVLGDSSTVDILDAAIVAYHYGTETKKVQNVKRYSLGQFSPISPRGGLLLGLMWVRLAVASSVTEI